MCVLSLSSYPLSVFLLSKCPIRVTRRRARTSGAFKARNPISMKRRNKRLRSETNIAHFRTLYCRAVIVYVYIYMPSTWIPRACRLMARRELNRFIVEMREDKAISEIPLVYLLSTLTFFQWDCRIRRFSQEIFKNWSSNDEIKSAGVKCKSQRIKYFIS